MAVKESQLFERMRQRRAEGRGTHLSPAEHELLWQLCGHVLDRAEKWVKDVGGWQRNEPKKQAAAGEVA